MTDEVTPEAHEAARRYLAEPEYRRLRAYHESGHATWLFLDGRERDIRYIEIAARRFGPGVSDFDTGVCAYGGDAYAADWISRGVGRREQLARAARCVAFSFAGPICECMSTGWNNPKELWEDALRYDWENLFDTAATFADNPRLGQLDFGIALQAVYAIYPTTDQRVDIIESRHQRYLASAVRRLVDIFSRADVWQVVETLAGEFEPANHDRLEGDRVRQIIRGLWGTTRHEGIPLHRLGRKWGRRYGCLLSE